MPVTALALIPREVVRQEFSERGVDGALVHVVLLAVLGVILWAVIRFIAVSVFFFSGMRFIKWRTFGETTRERVVMRGINRRGVAHGGIWTIEIQFAEIDTCETESSRLVSRERARTESTIPASCPEHARCVIQSAIGEYGKWPLALVAMEW